MEAAEDRRKRLKLLGQRAAAAGEATGARDAAGQAPIEAICRGIGSCGLGTAWGAQTSTALHTHRHTQKTALVPCPSLNCALLFSHKHTQPPSNRRKAPYPRWARPRCSTPLKPSAPPLRPSRPCKRRLDSTGESGRCTGVGGSKGGQRGNSTSAERCGAVTQTPLNKNPQAPQHLPYIHSHKTHKNARTLHLAVTP